MKNMLLNPCWVDYLFTILVFQTFFAGGIVFASEVGFGKNAQNSHDVSVSLQQLGPLSAHDLDSLVYSTLSSSSTSGTDTSSLQTINASVGQQCYCIFRLASSRENALYLLGSKVLEELQKLFCMPHASNGTGTQTSPFVYEFGMSKILEYAAVIVAATYLDSSRHDLSEVTLKRVQAIIDASEAKVLKGEAQKICEYYLFCTFHEQLLANDKNKIVTPEPLKAFIQNMHSSLMRFYILSFQGVRLVEHDTKVAELRVRFEALEKEFAMRPKNQQSDLNEALYCRTFSNDIFMNMQEALQNSNNWKGLLDESDVKNIMYCIGNECVERSKSFVVDTDQDSLKTPPVTSGGNSGSGSLQSCSENNFPQYFAVSPRKAGELPRDPVITYPNDENAEHPVGDESVIGRIVGNKTRTFHHHQRSSGIVEFQNEALLDQSSLSGQRIDEHPLLEKDSVLQRACWLKRFFLTYPKKGIFLSVILAGGAGYGLYRLYRTFFKQRMLGCALI